MKKYFNNSHKLSYLTAGIAATSIVGSTYYFSKKESPQNSSEKAITLQGNKVLWAPSIVLKPEKQRELECAILHVPLKVMWQNRNAAYDFSKIETELKFRHRKSNGKFPVSKAYDYNWKKINKKRIKPLEETHQKNQIYNISECFYAECNLTRWRNPFCRQRFEEDVTKALIDKAKSTSTVNVANVGAGELFTDLRILSQAFKQQVKKINFFIIDPLYKNLIKDLRRPQGTKKGMAISLLDLRHKRYRSEEEERIKQFITWFSSMYPQSTLEIYLYASLADYQKDIAHNNDLKADVLIAADLEYLPAYSDVEFSQILKQDGIGMLLAKRSQVGELMNIEVPCYLVKTVKSDQANIQEPLFEQLFEEKEYTHLVKEYSGESLHFANENELEAYLNGLLDKK